MAGVLYYRDSWSKRKRYVEWKKAMLVSLDEWKMHPVGERT